MSKVEFGKCKALYGCAGLTADELYTYLSKLKCHISVVAEGSDSLPYCDIAIIDTVQTLLACKPAITSEMIVIVCDSIVTLSSLKNLNPFDYCGDTFSPQLLKHFIKLNFNATGSVKIECSKGDLVSEVVQSLIVTGILSDYNALTSKMNKPARKVLRDMMVDHILKSTPIEDIAAFLQELGVDNTDFINRLRTKYFKNLCQAIVDHYKGHSLSFVSNRYSIKDTYEITYFTKMIKDIKGK